MTAAAIRIEPCTPVIADLFGVPTPQPDISPAVPMTLSEAYQRITELEEELEAEREAGRQALIGWQRDLMGLADKNRELMEDARVVLELSMEIKDLAARLESHTLGR